LAVVLNVLLNIVVVGSCFWVGGERSMSFVYSKFFFFGGGMLIPLEFVPGVWSTVLMVMPWASAAYVPATLAVSADPLDRWWLVLLQLGWIAITFAACAVVFARGERKLSTEGG
jgi:ABC-type uncharacterized transport system permease subunit